MKKKSLFINPVKFEQQSLQDIQVLLWRLQICYKSNSKAYNSKRGRPKLIPTLASGISNTVQMRILFEHSKLLYKSTQNFLTSFGNFCRDLFYSRFTTRIILLTFKPSSKGIQVITRLKQLCYMIRGYRWKVWIVIFELITASYTRLNIIHSSFVSLNITRRELPQACFLFTKFYKSKPTSF